MLDRFNEITAFSPYGGQLIRETVTGRTGGRYEPENELLVREGEARDMFVYVPASGCPDAKQCQVLMVLRDESGEDSARQAMDTYGLAELAEDRHFILVFPEPGPEGWDHAGGEEDMDYLSRCFMALPGGKGRVGGFIGMIFYVGLTPAACAFLMTMSAKRPTHVAAVVLAAPFPAGYAIPAGADAPQAAWLCGRNAQAEAYLVRVNRSGPEKEEGPVAVRTGTENPNVRHMVYDGPLTAASMALAWEMLLSETRRWTNDTYGTYQARTDFAARGFVPHVADSRLGVNGGFAHTWYEYVPPQLRGREEKVPLVFYLHGIGCVPLYGAEQSGWHDIADREGFIVVYPKPAVNKMWNVWDDPSLPSDHAFLLALLEYLKDTYPIDPTRVYVTGFSMGGMMTHSLACAYPELFAAAAACNGYNLGYLSDLASQAGTLPGNVPVPAGAKPGPSPVRLLADRKKAERDWRMPLIQNAGLLDGVWPMTPEKDPMGFLGTLDYWKRYNGVALTSLAPTGPYESGLTADESFYDGADGRFLHQRWHSPEGGPALLELVLAKRMPHALDLRQLELAWQFLKKFSRSADGALHTGG